jgi:transcriptional regulator with XRE-family HTH domain
VSTSSLAKRYWCTGETPNMVRRQLGGAEPGALVPAARTPGQRRLEAAVLAAATRAMAGLRRHGHPLRPTSLITRVRPDGKVLGLRVHDAALDGLLAQLLPVVVGDRVRGVPGLRAHPRRDHLDLRRADGEVRLLGVTRERWRQALAAGLPVDLALAKRLDPREAVPDAPLVADLMSGVLRRLPLWRGADWLDGIVVNDVLELYWRGGPPSDSVSAILTASTCAIPATAAVSYRFRNAVRGVALSAAAPDPAPEPEWAWVDWLATTAPGPALDERAVRPLRPRRGLPDVWDQHEMRAALALRDIPTVYRLLTNHGVPRDRIATLTGQPPLDVDRILSGANVESYDTLTTIAKGLGVPLGYMGLAHDEEPAPDTPCDCATLDERTKRDRFLAHAALVTVGTTTTTWGCQAKSCRTARPV